MAVKVYINDVETDVKYGFPTEDILQNILDSGTLTVAHTTTVIKPKDEIIIDRDGAISYYYVSLVKRNIVSFNPQVYNYTLSITSPVIELQRIVLPNRSVTQPFTYSKSIYDVLSNYISIYANGLTFSSEFISRYSSIQAPELKWEQPTLYEVFNDMLETDGCIVTMSDFKTISFLDLSEREGTITDDDINDIYSEQSLEDYASDLDIDAKNVVYDTPNYSTYARFALKTTETILTVDNAMLILPKNLYAIDEFEFRWVYYDSETSSTRVLELDLTDFVVEKTVYNNYKSSTSLGLVTGDYKRNALYFEEGGNTIEGFGYNEDNFLGISSYRAITNIVRNECERLELDHDFRNENILEATFNVKYATKEDIRFVQRKENSDYLGTLINNQEVSSVDLKAFAKKNQELANRLANESLNVSFKKYYDYNDIPKKGATYGDYVLTSRQVYSYYDYYVVKGLLTANYVMQDITEALKQNKRYTSISSESFESNHLTIFEIEATTQNKMNYELFEVYLNNFGKADYYIDLAKAYIETATENITLAMPVSVHAKKNSVLINYEMVDNYSAGISAETEELFLGIGGAISMLDIPYVDDSGEFETIETTLYRYRTNRVPFVSIGETLNYIERTRNLPAVDDDFNFTESVFINKKQNRYKDNREKTKETIEFIFREDNVFIGDIFINENPIVYQGSTKTLEVRYSETETYSKYDKNTAKGSYLSAVLKLDNSMYADVTDLEWEALTIASWCVCDEDGNVYFATNTSDRYMYIVFKEIVVSFETTLEFGLLSDLTYHRSKDIGVDLEDNIFELEANMEFHRSKNIGFDLTSEFGLVAVLDFHRSNDIGIDLIPIFGLNADLDFHRSIDIGSDLSAELGLVANMTYSLFKPVYLNFDLTASLGLVANMTYTVYNPTYEWVEGGATPTIGQTCDGPDDVGNVRCENVCSFNVTGTFTTPIDVSTTKPTCTNGATYTSCRLLSGGNYLCTEFEGETETVCETCEVVL